MQIESKCKINTEFHTSYRNEENLIKNLNTDDIVEKTIL